MAWRFTSTELRRSTADARREALKGLVDAGTPTGLLAYLDGEPVGWCSLGPRATYGRLVRSRTLMPPDDRPAWALPCFFIRSGFRRNGVATALLGGAVAHAKAQGASVLEAFPDRNARTKPGSRGAVSMFREAGFREAPSRSSYFIVMRRELSH